MADLTRFGIKEVADVKFFEVGNDASVIDALEGKGAEVISFDTLKVSNIESTAESTDARGGKGNAALISWDYGREITVTLEDALLSMESLALMFGDKTSNDIIIDANKFPGTYTVVGTTYARNETDGKDHVFTFVIGKAKIQSETTITMEAEGDPTVLGMTLKVLRCKDGSMMQLIRDESPVDADGVGGTAYVTIVETDGKTQSYHLTAGSTWEAAGITGTFEPALPAKVTTGTYKKKA
jgi:hypothetical protein